MPDATHEGAAAGGEAALLMAALKNGGRVRSGAALPPACLHGSTPTGSGRKVGKIQKNNAGFLKYQKTGAFLERNVLINGFKSAGFVCRWNTVFHIFPFGR